MANPIGPQELPLFPLHTVLFPSMVLPLHIFEERYKAMVRHCLKSGGHFGVVLIKEGEEVGGPAIPHGVGTTARILSINGREDDTMDITVLGIAPFRLLQVSHGQPFLAGVVETIPPRTGNPERVEQLSRQARTAFGSYLELLGIMGNVELTARDLEMDPEALSYILSACLRTALPEKQKLLEAPSVEERLQDLLPLLERETQVLGLFVNLKDKEQRSRHAPPGDSFSNN